MTILKRHFPGLDLDSPGTTKLHRELIRNKPLLRAWYARQYGKYIELARRSPGGTHIELGSGGGFLKELFPEATTSSVLAGDKASGLVDLRLDAMSMELKDSSVDSFFMLDVLHHIPDPEAFLRELERCLKPGGFALIIEPASTLFGRFMYKNFHHEAFDEKAPGWKHPHDTPLSEANQAVPHIIFERDRRLFSGRFSLLRLDSIKKHTFLSYAASGGLTYEPPLPGRLEWLVAFIEAMAGPLMPLLGTYMDVKLTRMWDSRL